MKRNNIKAEIIRKTAKILSEDNIEVVLEGFAPRVEYDSGTKRPVRMFLPAVPDDAPDNLLRAIHGFADHESGHILFSSSEDICDSGKSKLWHYIHNCIEDPRVNKEMMCHYVGCRANLHAGYQYLFDNFEDNGVKLYSKEYVEGIPLSSEEDLAKAQLQFSSLWFASMSECELNQGLYDEMNLDRIYGDFNKKVNPKYYSQLSKQNKTPEDVRILTDYFEEFFSKEALDKMKPDKGEGKDPSDERGDKGNVDGSGRGKSLPDDENTFKSMEEQLSELIAERVKQSLKKSPEKLYWTDRFDKKKSRSALQGDVDVAAFETNVSQIANYVQKDISRMLEQRQRRYYTGGYRSGKLNSKSLHSVECGNQNIFKRKNEIRAINSAVSLLIDLSGSMNGSRIKVASESAYAMALLLQRLNIPFEIYGFYTENTSSVMHAEWQEFKKHNGVSERDVVSHMSPDVFVAIKEFYQPFDIMSKKALAYTATGSVGMIQNEDSKHVKKAIERLSVRPEAVKALFVFSDGDPAFCEPCENSMSNLRVIAEAAKRDWGVDIYSIGIQTDSVATFYENFSIIQNLNDLPKATFNFLKKAI